MTAMLLLTSFKILFFSSLYIFTNSVVCFLWCTGHVKVISVLFCVACVYVLPGILFGRIKLHLKVRYFIAKI